MFGLGGGMDPAKMKAMMRQMGIKQEEVESLRVIIEKSDGRIIIEEPSVSKITMHGQESWQISGKTREEEAGVSETDIKMVMEKTGKSEKESKKALEKSQGDIAQAIIDLN